MPENKEISLSISVREDSILKPPIFVNRFRVVKEDGLVHVFVGFNSAGQNLFSGLILLNDQTIVLNKHSVAPYYERLLDSNPQDHPAEEIPFTGGTPQLFYGNFLEFSHYGDLAQARLIYFSIWHLAVVNKSRAKSQAVDVPAETACVLNMPLALQLGMIRKIFLAN